MKKRNRHIGSSFEDLLIEGGIHEEVMTHAWKRVLAWQVSETMKSEGISKNQMAKRMKTSRTQIDRLLDPNNPMSCSEPCRKRRRPLANA